jgi:uncharacterized protein YndB with AHSA1/START domain
MNTQATQREAALGTIEEVDGGRVIRFERRLDHPIEKVWSALTEPAQLAGWLAAADELELVEGGRVVLRWLNSPENKRQWERYGVILPDDFDPEAEDIVKGTFTKIEPPRLLEMDTDAFGVLRWQLRETESGCALTFTSALPEDFADEMAPQTMAGWHDHLGRLANALEGRPTVDWSKISLDDWAKLRDRYAEAPGRAQPT